jgi:hypothetical protein
VIDGDRFSVTGDDGAAIVGSIVIHNGTFR